MAKAPIALPPEIPAEQRVSLYFKNDGSDKEYHIQLLEKEGGWDVAFQYGRRGRAMTPGLKNPAPLPFVEAWKLYVKTEAGQRSKGYTEDVSGALYQSSEREALFTGLTPQLLNEIDEAGFLALIDDPAWMFQEKFDGERLMIQKTDAGVMGINKKGLRIPIPVALESAVMALNCASCLIDSEQLADRAAAFDLLELDGACLRATGAAERKRRLDALLSTHTDDILISVISADDAESKRALYELVKTADGEGLVGKRANSPYESGRPNSGGSQLKRKFTASATVVVSAAHKTKRSVSMIAYDNSGAAVEIGNVTIPANHEIPAAGAIIEVKYLYAYEGGSLYQPTYKGARHDQEAADCVMGQLKYKAEGPASIKARAKP